MSAACDIDVQVISAPPGSVAEAFADDTIDTLDFSKMTQVVKGAYEAVFELFVISLYAEKDFYNG